MSRSSPSAIACLHGWKRLEPTSAQGTGTVGGSWACRTPQNLSVSTSACSLKRTCGRAARRPAPSANHKNFWSQGQMVTTHPSERARAAWQIRRVRHQCITGSGTPSVSVHRITGTQGNSRRTTAPLPFSYTQPGRVETQQLQISP